MGVVVADTGPLIALARIKRLDLLHRLYAEILVPPAVVAELALDSDRPGATVLKEEFHAGWIRSETVDDYSTVRTLNKLIDLGESEAIVLAEQINAQFLLIDDARGRRIARGRDVPVASLAGVLLTAKVRGEIGSVGAVLNELSIIGYRMSDRLMSAILDKAGE